MFDKITTEHLFGEKPPSSGGYADTFPRRGGLRGVGEAYEGVRLPPSPRGKVYVEAYGRGLRRHLSQEGGRL